MELIDSGKFGKVYRKVDTSGQVYAVKEEKQRDVFGLATDMVNEVDNIRKFKKNNLLLECYQMTMKDEKIKIYYEYLTITLHEWIHQTGFDERMKLFEKIFNDTAVILTMLHKNGYIHNDLKTNNIMIKFNDRNEYEFSKIIDYGKTFPVNYLHSYHAIRTMKLPCSKWKSNNLFVDEMLSFGLCMLEIILGRKVFSNKNEIEYFVNRFSTPNGYNIRDYLLVNIPNSNFKKIPDFFFKVFDPIFNSKNNAYASLYNIYNLFNRQFYCDIPEVRTILSMNIEVLCNAYTTNIFHYHRIRSYAYALETLYLKRYLTIKEVEAISYLFIEKNRDKHPQYSKSKELKDIQIELLYASKGRVTFNLIIV